VLIAVPGPLDSLLGLRLYTLVTFKKSSLISTPNSRIDDTRSTEMIQYEKQFKKYINNMERKSNNYTHRNLSFDSLPNVSGMGPVKLFK
jgi:hypothetical protein